MPLPWLRYDLAVDEVREQFHYFSQPQAKVSINTGDNSVPSHCQPFGPRCPVRYAEEGEEKQSMNAIIEGLSLGAVTGLWKD